jgi:hypothetical protein
VVRRYDNDGFSGTSRDKKGREGTGGESDFISGNQKLQVHV